MSKKTFRSRLGVERLEPRLCMSFGAVDTSFGTDGFVRFENVRTANSNDEAFAVASFPDGSVVMVGNSEVGKGPVTSFARLVCRTTFGSGSWVRTASRILTSAPVA